MAQIKYSSLRDNNTFAVHTIDINRPLFGEDIRCQVRYVRIDPFVLQDNNDKHILSVIQSYYPDAKLCSFINKKSVDEKFHDNIHYNYLVKVPISFYIETVTDSQDVEEYKHLKINMEFYCEKQEHTEFFKEPISLQLQLSNEQWQSLSGAINNQYMRFSLFFD